MVGEGGIVEGSLSLVVLSANGDFAAKECLHDYVLTVTARHMEGGTAVVVDCVRLEGEGAQSMCYYC